MNAEVIRAVGDAMADLPEAMPPKKPSTVRPSVPTRIATETPFRVDSDPNMALKYRELLEAVADLPARCEIAFDDAAADSLAVQHWNRVKAARHALLSRHAD